MSLNPLFTFDRYVPSAPRAVARAVCRAHATGGPNRHGCLFLLGSPGVGKTHLLHAIGHAAREHNTAARIVLITGTDLAADLVEAIRRDAVSELRRKYAQADVLLVDDLHVLVERPAPQAVVGQLFATCLETGVAVACAATCRPREMRELTASLPAPFGPRRVVIKRPSRAHVRRILRQVAKSWGVDPPARAVDRVARQSDGDARKALGGLARWHLEQKLSIGATARSDAPSVTCMS